MKIIFEDNYIMAAIKPVGMEAQASRGFEPDMESEFKNYLSEAVQNPYLGIVHRLDKPVSGIMLFAKTKEVAGRLSKSLAEGEIKKLYQAAVYGKPKAENELLTDYVKKAKGINISYICDKSEKEAKKALLSYKLMKSALYKTTAVSLLNIELFTGRHHQIRLQLAHHSLPIIGDRKYGIGSTSNNKSGLIITEEIAELEKYNIALACISLIFKHPVTGKKIEFNTENKDGVWDLFS